MVNNVAQRAPFGDSPEITAPASFDYGALDPHLASKIKVQAERIRNRIAKTVEDIIDVGRELVAIKEALPHGRFLDWVQTEIGISRSTAHRWMSLAKLEAKCFNLKHLPLDTAYQLTTKDASPEIIATVASKSAAGEIVPVTMVREMISDARQRRLQAEAHKAASNENAPESSAIKAPLDLNPICHAWRLATDEQRRDFAHLFGDDVRCYGDDDVEGVQEAVASSPQQRGKKLQEMRLGEAVADAFDELQDLAGQCREVVDNAPEGLNQTQRIQTLDETASCLEDLDTPDVSAELAETNVSLPKPRKPRSRRDQRDIALDLIAACIEALDNIDENDPRHEETCSLRVELENASSQAEMCEFPGMYG